VSRCCRKNCVSRDFEIQFAEVEDEFPEEEWRQMQDPRSGETLPGRMVSSLGRLRFASGRVARGHQTKPGYFVCHLYKRTSQLVHRLVARAFLGGPPTPQHTQINHKDGNKGNNVVSNLEYVTPQDNIVHRHAIANRSIMVAGVKQVESRVLGSMVWTVHESISSASKTLGVNHGNICHCISGRYRHTGGIEFRLAQKSELEIPGEDWRVIDLAALIRDKTSRL